MDVAFQGQVWKAELQVILFQCSVAKNKNLTFFDISRAEPNNLYQGTKLFHYKFNLQS